MHSDHNYFISIIGGNVTLLQIWGKDHGPWMQALHCIFGLGAMIGPLIAEPFLTERKEVEKVDVGLV